MSTRLGNPSRQDESQIAHNKRRRLRSRSDEEIQSEMDTRNLFYRSGWPTLEPLPLTTDTEGVHASIKNAYQHIERARIVLNVQSVNVRRAFFARRMPEYALRIAPEESYTTLVISVIGMPSTFQQAIIRIRDVFKKSAETAHIHIEMIDHRALDGLQSTHIRYSEEALLTSWRNIADIVRREPGERGERWLCLELKYRGLDAEHFKLTVVITTTTAADLRWWSTIIPALQTKSYGELSPQFEVLSASTLEGTDATRALIMQGMGPEDYENVVTMGSSVGISGVAKFAGTLGGTVTLSNGDSFGLTNYHVVGDDFVDEAISRGGRGALYPDNEMLKSRIQLFVSPADPDHEDYIQWHTDYISEHGSKASAHVEMVKATLHKVQEKDRTLGSLYAASGHRTVECEEFGTDLDTGKIKPRATKPLKH